MTDPVYVDEFESKLDTYERGRILKAVPPDAWEVIYATIHDLVEDVDQQHRRLIPGDPAVIGSQAALYALTTFEKYFKDAMEAAMGLADHPDKEFLQVLFQVRDRMDVLKQQEGK